MLYRQFTDLGSAPGYGWGLIGLSDTQYRYYHLSAFVPGLAEGDTVRQGDVIGYVGDTGNATPGGYHLHFEVRPGPGPLQQAGRPRPPAGDPPQLQGLPEDVAGGRGHASDRNR